MQFALNLHTFAQVCACTHARTLDDCAEKKRETIVVRGSFGSEKDDGGLYGILFGHCDLA